MLALVIPPPQTFLGTPDRTGSVTVGGRDPAAVWSECERGYGSTSAGQRADLAGTIPQPHDPFARTCRQDAASGVGADGHGGDLVTRAASQFHGASRII